MATQTPTYFIRELSPDDNVSGLSLGDEEFTPLKIYLKRHAKRNHQANTAKTYVVVEGDDGVKVRGYITLVCGQVVMPPPPDVGEYRFPDLPALKIARLAVNQDCRGCDLGTQLVQLAISIAVRIVMPRVGCRFLTLDAKRGSMAFYEKVGFRLVSGPENLEREHPVMFLDLGKTADAADGK